MWAYPDTVMDGWVRCASHDLAAATTSRIDWTTSFGSRLFDGVPCVNDDLLRTRAEYQPAPLVLDVGAHPAGLGRELCRCDLTGRVFVADHCHGDVADEPSGAPGVLLDLEVVAVLDVDR